MKKTGLYGYVWLSDYDAIVVADILDIYKYSHSLSLILKKDVILMLLMLILALKQ